jgi:3-carboxy-cis,cis-muconate cycloisomerase
MVAPPTDQPLLSNLLGDSQVEALFSADAELLHMTLFESALAVAEGAEGVISAEAAAAIAERLQDFVPDREALRRAAARDGVVVPDLVRQMRSHVGAPHDQFVHVGATSQDVVDTALVLRLAELCSLLEQRVAALAGELDSLAGRFGEVPLMGRTRRQSAVPIRAADRIAAWREPLLRHLTRLAQLRPRLLVLQFGGPVGTLVELGAEAGPTARRLAAALGLAAPDRSWHTQRDSIAEFAGWLSLVTGSLGKLGEDVGLMAQMGEIALDDGGGSSAMPHKRNPVKAEVLVALARYNAALLPALHHALVAEQERSGAAWTLEWLTLPQMAVTTGAALKTAIGLVGAIRGIGAGNG